MLPRCKSPTTDCQSSCPNSMSTGDIPRQVFLINGSNCHALLMDLTL